MSASISGTLFAVILGFVIPDSFDLSQIGNYLFSSITTIPVYIIYSFPVIIIYGIATSVVSEKAGEAISAKTQDKKAEFIVSGAMHAVFGLILFWYSLGASVLFFITDRILKNRRYEFGWMEAVKSLAIPSIAWCLCMAVAWWPYLF
ncbi:hypothetical protein [Terribacillus halophilus]|jgi:hypothetical protein|uniref:hypothetical protein n=1 Tax=Terribacillus halophilus TaxID=361279 RepID=UPI0009852E9F|nr:hypothetical protein [Terribacillus halophilus]